MSWKSLIFGFAIVIALASLGNADTIVSFTPSQDNTLIQNSAGTLSNALGNIYSGLTNSTSGNIRRGLVEFNLASGSNAIPADATITGATLTMTDTTTGTNNAETISLYRVLTPWGQGTSGTAGGGGAGTMATSGDATWLYAEYNTSGWTNVGGDFSMTLSGSATDSTNGQSVVWSGSSGSQLVQDIQYWVNSAEPNDGWLLQGNEVTLKTAHALDSMFSASPPVLTVSYAVPEPPAAWLGISGLLALAIAKGKTGWHVLTRRGSGALGYPWSA